MGRKTDIKTGSGDVIGGSGDNESDFCVIGSHFLQFIFHHLQGQQGQQRGGLG